MLPAIEDIAEQIKKSGLKQLIYIILSQLLFHLPQMKQYLIIWEGGLLSKFII